jgi:hypothetical protein
VWQVVRAPHKRGGELRRGERERPGLGPDLPVGRRLDLVAVLAAEEPPVLAGAEPLDVLAEHGDELGRDRHVAGGAASGSLPGPAFQPSRVMNLTAVGEVPAGGRTGLGKDQAPPSPRRKVAAVPGHAAEKVTGQTIRTIHNPPEAEPQRIVADSTRIRHDLGWAPERSALTDILADAWQVTDRRLLP